MTMALARRALGCLPVAVCSRPDKHFSCALTHKLTSQEEVAGALTSRPQPCTRPKADVHLVLPLANFRWTAPGLTTYIPRGHCKVAASGVSTGSDDIKEEATGLRRLGWISFWAQLALSIVSAIVLFFTATTASQGKFPKLPVFFNLAGVVTGFISTFLAFGKTRVARKVLIDGEKYSKSKVAAQLLGATRLNLLGLGATIVGLQSTVGGLVGKALTSSSTGAYNVQAAGSAPAALDVFAVQASTNTILLHFIALLFSNWTLRLLNKDAPPPAAA